MYALFCANRSNCRKSLLGVENVFFDNFDFVKILSTTPTFSVLHYCVLNKDSDDPTLFAVSLRSQRTSLPQILHCPKHGPPPLATAKEKGTQVLAFQQRFARLHASSANAFFSLMFSFLSSISRSRSVFSSSRIDAKLCFNASLASLRF